jgi:FkbM family methyltransferase
VNKLMSPAALAYYASSAVTLLTRFSRPIRTAAWFLSRARLQPEIFEIRSPRLRFRVRSKMDIWSVKEAAVDRCYEKFGFRLQPGWTVVDLGAAIGEFAIAAASHPVSRVLAFEPSPASVALLHENASLNRLENIEIFDLAVSDKAGTARLDTSGEPLQMTTRAGNAQSIEVRSITLSEVLALAGGEIDLLKIDCEGAEYEILMSSTGFVLDRIHRIVLEYHDHRADVLHTDLIRHLAGSGFEVEVFPNVVHPTEIGYMRAARPALRTPLAR